MKNTTRGSRGTQGSLDDDRWVSKDDIIQPTRIEDDEPEPEPAPAKSTRPSLLRKPAARALIAEPYDEVRAKIRGEAIAEPERGKLAANSPYHGASNLEAFAAVFGIEITFDTIYPNTRLSHLGQRKVFKIAKNGGLVCVFMSMGKDQTVKKKTTVDFPTYYALWCGYTLPELVGEDGKKHKAMWRVWSQKLLHDAKLLKVRRTLFRTPAEKFREKLCPKPRRWALACAIVNGLGLRCDTSDDPKAFVPYSARFIVRYNREAFELCYDPEPATPEETEDWLQRMEIKACQVRWDLIAAGLVGYEGPKIKRRYHVKSPDEGQPGKDHRELWNVFAEQKNPPENL